MSKGALTVMNPQRVITISAAFSSLFKFYSILTLWFSLSALINRVSCKAFQINPLYATKQKDKVSDSLVKKVEHFSS